MSQKPNLSELGLSNAEGGTYFQLWPWKDDWTEKVASCVIAALSFTVQSALFPGLTKINEVAACHFKIHACICNSFACLCQLSIICSTALFSAK